MAQEYHASGVRFVAVMGLIQDDIPKIESFLKETEISFPVIRDEEQIQLTNLRATRTPKSLSWTRTERLPTEVESMIKCLPVLRKIKRRPKN